MWSGAAWNHVWDSTMHVLSLLREMGLDPASDPARRAVGLVRDCVTWQGCGPPACDGNPFFAGEVEPCINGQVAASGAYFGQDIRGIVDRLLGEQLPDGGWNCEAERGSTRSSFNTTICVLEALLEHERAGTGSPEVTEARLRGQEYLLDRRLFRRRSTGAVVDPAWRASRAGGTPSAPCACSAGTNRPEDSEITTADSARRAGGMLIAIKEELEVGCMCGYREGRSASQPCIWRTSAGLNCQPWPPTFSST